MIKTKDELRSVITRVCRMNIGHKRNIQQNIMALKNNYNIPLDMASDILMLKDDMEGKSDFVLFCVLDTINHDIVRNYFTEAEIKTYSSTKYKDETVEFPIRFKMIQVADDQWIGSISARQLMQLRDAQLIRYNENAQRTMQHVIRGGVEYYRISLNKKAVEGIQESMLGDMYIPNTITLNMPEDTVYSYNGSELIINSMDYFDILDGYHRYIALSKLYNTNPAFDYNMELRIVSFSEGKARQFIWQEDQKTKMRKADSDSLKQDSEANRIVQKLNTDGSFVLSGGISRNRCVINAAELSLLIQLLWYRNKAESQEVKARKRVEISGVLKDGIEAVVGSKPELAYTRWEFKYLACVICCIYAGVPTEKINGTAERIYGECKEKIVPYRISFPTLRRLIKLI